MMNVILRYKYPLILMLAVVCAAGAVWLTKYYFDSKERELREKIRLESQLFDVVVAKANLDFPDFTRHYLIPKSTPLQT